MPISDWRKYLPPALTNDFPDEWSDMMVQWDIDGPWKAVRIKLWFPFSPSQSAQSYWLASSSAHLLIWEWFEARFALPKVPQLEYEGHGAWDASLPPSESYHNLAIFGTYWHGSRRSTTPSSSTSSPSSSGPRRTT